MHMMEKGFLRLPLSKILFQKALLEFLKRDPEDADFNMSLQLLSALGLIEAVEVPCDDMELLLEETPGTPRRGSKIISSDQVQRFFVPSLSPFLIPDELRQVAPILFHRGVKVRFEFNMLPNELWWRLQSRLQSHQQVITVRCPQQVDEEDDDDAQELRLPESDDDHNRWRDAMWLKNDSSRVLLLRDGPKTMRFFSMETSPTGADDLLKVVEENLSEILAEYRGIQRVVQVACPVPTCNGWHDVNSITPDADIVCTVCRQTIPHDAIIISGVSPLGPHLFSAATYREAGAVVSFALDEKVGEHLCGFLGVAFHPAATQSGMVAPSDGEDDEVADLSRVNPLTAMDKVIRGALLKDIWRRHQ
jgi:hypothetical protein